MKQFSYFLSCLCFFQLLFSVESYQKKLEILDISDDIAIGVDKTIVEGFRQGVLVQGIAQYIPIEQLQLGDLIDGKEGEQQIIAIKKHTIDDLVYYALTTEQHGFYIYPDMYVHNMDAAVITSTASLLLGIVEIINPVVLLAGGLISLTGYALNSYVNNKIEQKVDLQQALQDIDVIKKTRCYYETKRNELFDLYQEMLLLKQKINFFFKSNSHNCSTFSSEFLSLYDYKSFQVLLLPHVSIELAYSLDQKEKLLLLREAELQKLEAEIIDIAVMLGFHVNELIERKNNAFEQLKTIEKQVNGVVNIWNQNLYYLSCEIALDHYKKHFLWQESLSNFELVICELTLLQKFYEHQKSCFFVSKMSNVLRVLSEQVSINNTYLNVVKANKNILVSNIVITEHFLREHGLLSVELINCYRSEAKKIIADKELKGLALAKKKKKSIEGVQKKLEQKNNSGGGNKPDKDPDENKHSGVSGYFVNSLKHIFRQAEGHLSDTPENRKLLLDMASNLKNRLGIDIRGNVWYGEILDDGKQLWAWARDNLIRDAGINEIPRMFNEEVGLCRGFVNRL